jgi:DNA (cytosine-5)-methyltransferase 1
MTLKFIDLFAGLGGIRIGFEQAAKNLGIKTQCILTSEIKPAAIESLKNNFKHENLVGDINEIKTNDIKDFDILLGGFPCQAFSFAGKQRGFGDTRGTLFFQIERLIKEKMENGSKPKGFILENVEGLVRHDQGKTYITIINTLESLGYKITSKVLDSKDFGVAQSRKRIYIVGVDKKYDEVDLSNFKPKFTPFSKIMEKSLPGVDTLFTKKILSTFKPEFLYGKCLKDKRGGNKNIHSWDLELKGKITADQKLLLNLLFKERRKKHWAEKIGIEWMDGMPLTKEQIQTFCSISNLQYALDDLVEKKYLVFEYPKKKIKITNNENTSFDRVPDETKPKGYNIVAGKLSFDFSLFLDPNTYTPTMVAMDMNKIGVVDNGFIRNLTLNEGLNLFGYPRNYNLNFLTNDKKGITIGFDLLGNSVCVPVIKAISERLLNSIKINYDKQT